MKKNKKGLITAVILLILLLIVYIVIRNLHLDEEEEEDSTETVYEIDAADISKLQIVSGDKTLILPMQMIPGPMMKTVSFL